MSNPLNNLSHADPYASYRPSSYPDQPPPETQVFNSIFDLLGSYSREATDTPRGPLRKRDAFIIRPNDPPGKAVDTSKK